MPPYNSYLSIIEPIIKQAGKRALRKWQDFDRQNSQLKNKKEIVTQVDLDTEKFLIKTIKRAWPTHSFLAEESGASQHSADFKWFIDPIDGSTNFSIHNPLWSISLGLAYKNQIIFGVIYIPVLNELFWAAKNKGAYLNKKRVILKAKLKSKKLIHTYCHGNNSLAIKQAIAYYQQQKMQALDCRQLGSAAIELTFVAAGRVDSLMIPGVHPWDVAAGALIAKEAGAQVIDFKGRPWEITSQSILACHPQIKTELLKIIKSL